jgi:hypothetical protein
MQEGAKGRTDERAKAQATMSSLPAIAPTVCAAQVAGILIRGEAAADPCRTNAMGSNNVSTR